MPSPAAPADLEVVTIGRVGVDLYPEQAGVRLREVERFVRLLGGSATNVAVGAARLGRRAAVVTKVGDDEFGAFAREAIAGFGVWPGWVGTDPELRTPLAFAELHPPDDFPLLFYREPMAPDLRIEAGDIDAAAIAAVPLLWVTGGGLSAEPSRATTIAAMGDRAGRGLTTILDLDYRPSMWADAEAARRSLREALVRATVVVGNETEIDVLTGAGSAPAALDELLVAGPELVVVKRGPAGLAARARDGRQVAVPALPVDVVCGLGAGDAFGAALCHGLLSGWPLERTLAFAAAAGALVASRLACAAAMPTAAEVLALQAANAAKTDERQEV